MKNKKLISIITPCFNEQDNVLGCYKSVKEIFNDDLPDYEYEHIFSDNASTDNTVSILKNLSETDKHIKIIVNSRNYGPFRSTYNAIRSSSGDAVIPMLAVDLQDPPSLIPVFVENWEKGYQIIAGARKQRKEGLIMRSLRKLFYQIVSKLSDFEIPPNVGEFQLIDKIVVDALRQFDDSYPYIRGMIASCGFKSMIVEYTWEKRKKGKSKNNLYNLIDQALNGIISFTNIPLRMAIFLGLFISILSILYSFIQLLINIIYYRNFAPPGIATLIVAIFFFAGVQLFFMGLLGEYISAIHSQVRKRPLVIEKERINFEN